MLIELIILSIIIFIVSNPYERIKRHKKTDDMELWSGGEFYASVFYKNGEIPVDAAMYSDDEFYKNYDSGYVSKENKSYNITNIIISDDNSTGIN